MGRDAGGMAGTLEARQGEAALGEQLLIRKPRPWRKTQPEAFGDVPITTAKPPRLVSGRASLCIRRSETACDGNCGQSTGT